MPDDTRLPEPTSPTPPEHWQQAFAALPLETPPAGGWERLAPRLHKRRSSARYWVPAALAASLAVLMVLPWKSQNPESTSPTVATTTTPDTSAIPVGAPSKARALPPSNPNPPEAPLTSNTSVATTNPASTPQDATAQPTKRPQSKKPKPVKSSAEPPPLVNQAPMLADSGSAPASAPDATASDAVSTPTTTAPTLESLYAESARLEALLSQIRDDTVSSGTSMALSAELHDRVTGIDAALSQPDLAADARLKLWRERVATLQRLAGVETTQRWMVANGYRADGQIAQVY